MPEEEGTRSRSSSISTAGSGCSELFARDIAAMADRVGAAEAVAKLAKEKYTAGNQTFKGYNTALHNKLQAKKECHHELVTRNAQVKAASDDPEVVEIAKAIKDTGRMKAIIRRLQDKELTGEKAIE